MFPSPFRSLRERAGLTQAALAEAAGVSRQTLNAIEAGRTDPAVSIVLRLARALGCRVEELFDATANAETVDATLASPSPANTRVSLSWIGSRWVAHPLAAPRMGDSGWSADGITVTRAGDRRSKVELIRPADEVRDTVIVLGCAPALGLLVDRLNTRRGPGRFVWLQQSSTAALNMLGEGLAHIAGIHLRDDAQGVAKGRVRHLARVTFASWQAGLVVAKGNPLALGGVEDLCRPRLRFATREPGSGARLLLDQLLVAAKLSPRRVHPQAREVHSQLEVGQAVSLGIADAGLAMLPVALAYGLDFIPLADERFDLVFRSDLLGDARIKRLLDELNAAPFRRELGSVGGYDVSACGRAVQ